MSTDQTPDQLLSQEVVADLRKEKLLTEKQLGELPAKLESGKLKPEDWKGIIEVAVDSNKAGKNAKAN